MITFMRQISHPKSFFAENVAAILLPQRYKDSKVSRFSGLYVGQLYLLKC